MKAHVKPSSGHFGFHIKTINVHLCNIVLNSKIVPENYIFKTFLHIWGSVLNYVLRFQPYWIFD